MEKQTREIGVSIIICSYNSENKITPTLKALEQQIVNDNIKWEIIFVDNNSTDKTKATVENNIYLFDNIQIPITVLDQNTPGKLHAFNLGIEHAKYSYFIIVDDDNWLAPNYIETAFHLIHNKPNIGVIGSHSIPAFEDKKVLDLPQWFIENKHCYAIGEQGKDGDISKRGYVWGAGLVSKTDLYEKMYKNHPSVLFDNNIADINYAEDTEYCMRLILKGYELHYSSTLTLQHYTPNERLSNEYWNALHKKTINSFQLTDYYTALIKLNNKKYINRFAITRLKIASLFRYYFTGNKVKKQKNKILLEFLFHSEAKHNIVVKILTSFINDKSLINPQAK